MITDRIETRRVAQLAILLTLLFAAPTGVNVSFGQVAGFASSRTEAPATSESGARRALAVLNPFSRSQNAEQTNSGATPAPLITPAISQPVVASPRPVPPASPSPAPSVASRPKSAPSSATSALSLNSAQESSLPTARQSVPNQRRASVRPGVAIKGNSSAQAGKKSATGGVASLLLDELEDEIGDSGYRSAEPSLNVSNAKSSRTEPKVVRKSLRANSFPSSLELLSDESEDDGDKNDELIEDEGPATVFSTDSDFDSESDEVESSDEESDDEKEEVLADEVDESDLLEDEASEAVVVQKSKVAPSKPVAKSERVVKKAAPKKAEPVDAKEVDEFVPSEVEPKVAESVEPVMPETNVSKLDARLDSALTTNGVARIAANPVSEPATNDQASTLSTGRAPNVEIVSFGPKKLVVGQESQYQIKARNFGSESARKLVVTTEIPESMTNVSTRVDFGVVSVQNVDDRAGVRRCSWLVDELPAGSEYELILTMTPTKRIAFALESRFEFERSSSCAEVEVQEPILETLIEGRDSIEWGIEDKYRLRLRNIGNGDAENVVLNVSTGENRASQKIGLLRAGEEKTVEMSVKTAAEEFFMITAEAVGAYGLSSRTSKKVEVLRGRLDVEIEAPDLQFVDGEFETIVRVRNIGAATLENVDVVAQLPTGVELLQCSNQARRNPEKRRVYWVAPFIRPGEEVAFSATCRAKEAGTVHFEAVGVDQTGLVAQARTDTSVESIAVLAMRVNAPKEPIAVGKTCVYELIVENNGTRDARDVNTGIFLGSGLKPLEVENGLGYVYEKDSKALFKKIELLRAGETAVFRVKAEALTPGNQKIQAMLQSTPEDTSLLSEETTYCYAPRVNDSRENRLGVERMTADRESGRTMRK